MNPVNIPEAKSDVAFPIEQMAKRLLALAWLITNSSSIKGRIGEKINLLRKLKNHKNQSSEIKRSALPLIPE